MKSAKQQRGLSMTAFLFGAIVLILVLVVGMKLIPAYIQDGEIKQVFDAVAHDPGLSGATRREIELAYAKRASVADINAIKLEDVDISKDNGDLVLSTSYQVKIPLVANISLLLDFNPSSAN